MTPPPNLEALVAGLSRPARADGAGAGAMNTVNISFATGAPPRTDAGDWARFEAGQGKEEALVEVAPDATLLVGFDADVVGDEAIGQEAPEVLTIFPTVAGRVTWRDRRTLQLVPAAPLPDDTRYYASVFERPLNAVGTRVVERFTWCFRTRPGVDGRPVERVGNKVFHWAPVARQPRLIGFAPVYGGLLGPGERPSLIFDQAVEPVEVAGSLTLLALDREAAAGYREVAFTVQPRADAVLEGVEFPAGTVMEVVPAVALAEGQHIQVKVEPAVLPKVWTEPWWLPWSQAAPVVLETTECEQPGEYWTPMACARADGRSVKVSTATWLRFVFSNPVEAGAFGRGLSIKPAPLTRTMPTGTGFTQFVSLTLEPGQRYEVEVAGEVEDVYGYRLGAPTRFTVQAEDLPALLEVPASSGTLEVSGPMVLPVVARNVVSVDVVARVLDVDGVAEGLAAMRRGAPLEGVGATVEVVPTGAGRNAEERFGVELGRFLEGRPGVLVYRLTPRARDGHLLSPVQGVVQVTNLAVSTHQTVDGLIVWATHHDDGIPVAGAQVQLAGREGEVLGTARADSEGVVHLAQPSGQSVYEVVVREGADVVVESVGRSYGGGAWRPSHAAWMGPEEGSEVQVEGFVDRGVYRPGEEVQLGLVARRLDKGGMRALANAAIEVKVTDGRGRTVAVTSLKAGPLGTARTTVTPGADAALGRFRWEATCGGAVTSGSFLVEHYRAPRFAVALGAPTQEDGGGPGLHLDEGPISLGVHATPYAGGELGGVAVRWLLTRRPARLEVEGREGFTFGVPEQDRGLVLDSSGTLDATGRATITLGSSEGERSGPWYYEADVEVQDVDRQAVQASRGFVVHDRDLYLGVKLPETLEKAGVAVVPEVIAMDGAMKVREGVPATLRLVREEYHTVARRGPGGSWANEGEWVWEEAGSCVMRTNLAGRGCALVPPVAGSYRVEVVGKDGHGRALQAATEFYAYGDDDVPWEPETTAPDALGLVADALSYTVGQQARVLVKSPWRRSEALVTVTSGAGTTWRVVSLVGSAAVVPVDLTAGMAPTAVVAVTVIRGREGRLVDGAGMDRSAPAAVHGRVELSVDSASQRLGVEVAPSAPEVGPGQAVEVDLHVTDADGHGHAGEAFVWVVDEAVLALTAYETPDLHAQFYAPRWLPSVQADTREDLLAARVAGFGHERIGGDGVDGDTGDAASQEGERERVREDFRATVAFVPGVLVDHEGRGHVSVTLPDGLTRYRIMAAVVDEADRFGRGQAALRVSKPLRVEPSLPRFLRVGDTFELAATVTNRTDADQTVTVGVDAGALDLSAAAPTVVAVPAGQRREVRFPARAARAGTTSVWFTARAGGLVDHVEVALAVEATVPREAAATAVASTESVTVNLAFPEGTLAEGGELELLVSTTMLSELAGSMDYVVRYPYGCVEQTTSATWPMIALRDHLDALGIVRTAEEVDVMVRAGLDRLASMATPSGGLAYWPGGGQPHAFGTALAMLALTAGKRGGYPVSEVLLNDAADWLERELQRGPAADGAPAVEPGTRSMALLALARAGRPQAAAMAADAERADALPTLAVGMLGLALAEAGPTDEQRELVVRVLESRFDRSPDGPRLIGPEPLSPGIFDSEERTVAVAAMALTKLVPGSALAHRLLTSLLARRQDGHWSSTQANFWAIGALAASAEVEKADGPPRFEVQLGDEVVAAAEQDVRKESASLRLPLARVLGHETLLLDNPTGRRLRWFLRARYSRDDRGEALPAVANGLAVFRRYETVDGEALGTSLASGEVVRVRLWVQVERDAHWVALVDPLPAGLEPINLRFATGGTMEASEDAVGRHTTESGAWAGYWAFNHQEQRDDRVLYFADRLYGGVYELSYLARATSLGSFAVPPPRIEAMYAPEVFGRGMTQRVMIAPRER